MFSCFGVLPCGGAGQLTPHPMPPGPLCRWDRSTFYSPGDDGYLDYPTLADTQEGQKLLAAAGAA